MLTVVLAATTAVLFGVADFLGGIASRRDSAVAVTAVAHAVGLVMFALAAAVFPAAFTTRAALAGAVAGVCSGIGVASLFSAMSLGRMSVVAPITAALSGSLPAVYDFARGERLSALSIAGLALALLATVIVSASASDGDGAVAALPPRALGLSLLSGAGFAGSFVSFSLAPADSGFWPLLTARVASFGMLAIAALVAVRRVTVRREVRGAALGSGVLDATANFTMVTAIRTGPLAVVSVLGSLYPVATILLARVVLGERLEGRQRLGVALALLAVVLASLQ